MTKPLLLPVSEQDAQHKRRHVHFSLNRYQSSARALPLDTSSHSRGMERDFTQRSCVMTILLMWCFVFLLTAGRCLQRRVSQSRKRKTPHGCNSGSLKISLAPNLHTIPGTHTPGNHCARCRVFETHAFGELASLLKTGSSALPKSTEGRP